MACLYVPGKPACRLSCMRLRAPQHSLAHACCLCCTQLLSSSKVGDLFPSDVVARAEKYLAAIPGGTGAYSDSRGAMVLRADIAKARFIIFVDRKIMN